MRSSPQSAIRNPQSEAFTLLELILSMAVAMLIIGIAVLSVGSVGKERDLRSHAGVLETTARTALQNAVRTGNPIPLRFSKNEISMGDKSHQFGTGQIQILRAGASSWRTPSESETWTFYPSGLCEPIAVRITNATGKVEVRFDPLTGAAEHTDVEIFSGS